MVEPCYFEMKGSNNFIRNNPIFELSMVKIAYYYYTEDYIISYRFSRKMSGCRAGDRMVVGFTTTYTIST